MIVFLSASMLCALIGGRANAKRTLAFEEAFCKEPEGLLWKQFTRLGKGAPSYIPEVSIIGTADIIGIMALPRSCCSRWCDSSTYENASRHACAGTGKLLVSESPSVFKLHANGHKNLDGAVMTMTLLRRHELVGLLSSLPALSLRHMKCTSCCIVPCWSADILCY